MLDNYFPYFQPIIDVGKKAIVGYEALGRTRNTSARVESLGPLFNDPNFDRSLLLQIDRTVRERAMRHLAKNPGNTFLSLNISPEWMNHVPDYQVVPSIEMARHCGLAPERVLIEFVEGVGETLKMQMLLKRYRQAGMKIAIDDFGAGHSHVDRLVALEPDIIKMDMAFFKRGMISGISKDVVRSLGALARRTGSLLLCEGVETREEFYFALDCGARYVQGYFFYPPAAELVPPEHPKVMLDELLEKYLSLKISQQKLQLRFHQDITEFFHKIEPQLLADPVDVMALPEAPVGFLRVYLCHRSGEQISPNYESCRVEDGYWSATFENLGMNWAMRPYFHQILAVGEQEHRRHSISTPYRDLRTGKLCQTMGILLENNRVLLADIACSEEVNIDGDDIYIW